MTDSILKSKNKSVLIVSVVVGVVLIYIFASLAIDRGNLWWYLIFIVLTLKVIRDFLTLVKIFIQK